MSEIIVRTPTRISLFGGGTDVNPYAEQYGGEIISLAIDIYQEYTLNTAIGASSTYFDGDIKSGLGSSGSFFVSFIAGQALANDITLTKDEIAEAAWELEHILLRKYTGKQDQYMAVYGGLSHITFGEKVTVEKLPNETLLSKWLLLFKTGLERKNLKVQEQMRELTGEKIDALNKMKILVHQAKELIVNDDIYSLGDVLKQQWELKKQSNPILSSPEIDIRYETGIKAGALGGKLVGAGGGGYMVFLVAPTYQNDVVNALEKIGMEWVEFEPDTRGLYIIT